METQALIASRSSHLILSQSLAQCQRLHDGRSVCIPSSLGKQWSFRVERRKLTLLSGRRKTLVDVRAKKSGVGSSRVKSKESEPEEEDAEPAAKTKTLFKLPGTQKLPSKGGNRSKDNNTVFVAGATGKVGRRTVKELVRSGYNVRAGVRNPDKAQFLLEQEEEKEESDDEETEERPMKKSPFASFSIEKLFSFLGPRSKRIGQVELVPCDLEKSVDDIEEALGNAGVVICTIGASEKEVLDITGPYRIDYKATANLIDAAKSANVNHFILVTSLGTQKFGWPAAVLNLFWGVLYWKAKAEKALVESGIPFTIVRPGGMERPTDAYKETHNLRLAEADTLFGGQVSNLQVAELMASVVGNLDLARNKVLEAVAETTAPLRPFEDLLAEIPSIDEEIKPVTGRSEMSRKNRQAAKQQTDEERASAIKRQAAERERTEAVRQKLQEEYEAARLKEEEARQEAEAARAQKAEIERRTAELRSKLQAAEQFAREAKALESALITAARQGKKLSEREKQDIIKSIRAEVETEKKAAEAKQRALQAPREKPEAKAMAPVKSKADVAAEKQAKQEAEKKAKQEAEAKAAEAELATKAEAEAKAKADAAEKKRMEAEQKAKEEEKQKVEAGRKAKEEEEEKEKQKIEAELKAKEEEELRKIEAEREGNEKEEEEKKRIELEKKKQEEEEKETAAKFSAEVKPQGFRWPWQREEPEEEIVSSSPSTIEETVAAESAASSTIEETFAAEEPQTKELPRPSRPLSPYTQFPNLKPPAPPSPPLSVPKLEEDVTKAATTVPEEPVLEKEEKEEETLTVVSKSAPVEETKAQSGGFRWPWQKPEEPEEEPPQEETAAETPIEETAPVNQTIIREEVTTKETGELPRPSRPLSPYTAFPNLKPPVPPSPPLSVPKLEEDISKAATTVPEEPVLEKEEETPTVVSKSAPVEETKAQSGGFRWPWQKPEPEEEPPQEEAAAETPIEETAPINQTTIQEEATTEETGKLPRPSRPLSPYSAYPGLKPPQPPLPPKVPTKVLTVKPESEESESVTQIVDDGEMVTVTVGTTTAG